MKMIAGTEYPMTIIVKAEMIKPTSHLAPLLRETDELVAILFTSIKTAKKRKER